MEAVTENIKLLLIKSLSVGFDEVFLETDKLGHIWKMYLHRVDGVYLSVGNKMINIEERKEEGQLVLAETEDLDERGHLRVCFPMTRGKSSAMYLFFSQDERNTKPCGFRIVDKVDISHDVVVGAAPNSLVFLTPLYEEKKKSEYSIDYYSLTKIIK